MTTIIESDTIDNDFNDTTILLDSIKSEEFQYNESNETYESNDPNDPNKTQESDENQETGVVLESDMAQACPICFEDSVNMIIFECNHTICIECLEKIFWSQGKSNILCPICRHIVEQYPNAIQVPEPITNNNQPRSNCLQPMYYIINFICFAVFVYTTLIIVYHN